MHPKESSDIIQASRRFFGYALSHEPSDLYERALQPRPIALGTRVTDYLVSEIADKQLMTDDELRKASILFAAAINDTQTILMQEARTRTLPLEYIPLIARDPRTITSIARIAMHSDGYMRTIISPTVNKKYFNLSDDASHVQVTNNLVDAATGGCPFAASSDRVVKPDPIFRNTIHLAGDLTYLAYKK